MAHLFESLCKLTRERRARLAFLRSFAKEKKKKGGGVMHPSPHS